jgi:HSP20 family protein
MGIMDKITALVPGRGRRQEPSRAAFDALALRDDLDRWVQRFFEEPGGLSIADFPAVPFPDIRETDQEFLVTMEVPGLDREDLDLSIRDGELTISGRRREETHDTRRGAAVEKNSYRYLLQTLSLPPGIDPDRAEARVDRGVLTVRFPKTETRSTVRRVPVTA